MLKEQTHCREWPCMTIGGWSSHVAYCTRLNWERVKQHCFVARRLRQHKLDKRVWQGYAFKSYKYSCGFRISVNKVQYYAPAYFHVYMYFLLWLLVSTNNGFQKIDIIILSNPLGSINPWYFKIIAQWWVCILCVWLLWTCTYFTASL